MSENSKAQLGPAFSIVIPSYNSDETLIELARRTDAVFKKVLCESYELIIVDDGSSNTETWRVCELIASQFNAIALRLTRNYGKAGAILCGLNHASGQWVITIDDDLQQIPEDIPALAKMRSHDVVVGCIVEKKHGRFIRLTSKIKSYFDRLILGVPHTMSPMKLIRSEVVTAMLEAHSSRPFIPAMLSDVTSDFVSVPITHSPSRLKESRYSMLKRLSQFSNLVIGNSTLLLRVIGMIGAATSISGFVFAIYTIVRALVGIDILSGWASLIVINLTFGGLILIALGINGEYLLRTLENTSNKPAYRVQRISSRKQRE